MTHLHRTVAAVLLPLTALALAPAVGLGASRRAQGAAKHNATAGRGESFTGPIEKAQGKKAWYAHRAVKADLDLHFGGKHIKATMWLTPSVSKVRMEMTTGTVLVFNGKKAWVAPPDADMDKPRFTVRTWPYFMAVPFKLNDPGTHLQPVGERMLRKSEKMPAAKMTFGRGVGDAPSDRYVLYRDPRTNHLAVMAYTVTYGGTPIEQAEKNMHAIVYSRFRKVDGVTLATRWRFYHWSKNRGMYGKAIGRAALSHIQFVHPSAKLFTRPDGAKLAPRPDGETKQGP